MRIKLRVLPKPNGNIVDLEHKTTTMWHEETYKCSKNDSHKVTGSTRLLYCYTCGKYWNRRDVEL